jgi:hypothetical protein
MKWALVDSSGMVQNVIEYDGVTEYTPPEGISLQQVNEWVQIGKAHDAAEPIPEPVIPQPVQPTLADLQAQLSSIQERISSMVGA